MKLTLVTIFALVGSITGKSITNLFSDEHIQSINSKATTWVAGKNFPEGTTKAQLKRLLVTRDPSPPVLKYKMKEEIKDDEIPPSFDARQYWSNCTSIQEIRDQSACASCWAVASTSVMSDRICIKTHGQQQPRISTADILSCCELCEHGCQGGAAQDAFIYWCDQGIVSGGEYGSKIGCKPYPYPQCGKALYAPCPDTYYTEPTCIRKCSNESRLSYDQDLYRGASLYYISRDELQIQNEILNNGPVAATFEVYLDFFSYKSGVYHRTELDRELYGHHVVRVIGWGVENNLPYWLATNSWNEGWGDKGLFKIRRGECNFESRMISGLPPIY